MATVPAAPGRPEVVLLGFTSALTNRWVDDDAHAGLAVRALGRSPRLVWYQPDVGDLADRSSASAPTPWPRWLGPAAAIVATAVLLLAVVRGRRMGPLVVEPLPVVIRATETTQSRGRIYRKARDRARAAAILRQGSTKRIARRLAVSERDTSTVVAAAVDATALRPAQVTALLYGPPPTTDADLLDLARSLTDLEERLHAR